MRSLVFVAGAGLASIVACGSQVTYVDPGSGGNASLLTAAMTTMSPNGGYLQIADTKGGVAKDITTITSAAHGVAADATFRYWTERGSDQKADGALIALEK